MKFLKNAAVRATALLVFAAMISAVILWQAGAYDISFIKRPAPHITDTAGTTGSGDDTDPSDNTTTTPGTTEPPETEPPTDTTVSGEDAEKLLDLILSYADMKKDGWKISDGVFGQSSSIARLGFDTGNLKNKFAARKVTESKNILYRQADGTWIIKTVKDKVTLPSVRLYFGLILLDNGKSVSVYNSDGKQLVKNFTGSLVNAKTDDGDPAVMIGGKYYGINEKTGRTGEISADRIDFNALRFDSPSYFAPDTGLYPFSQYVDVLTEITTAPPTSEPPETDPPETDSGSDPGTDPEETTEGSETDPPAASEDDTSVPPETDGSSETDNVDIPVSEKKNEAGNAVTTEIDGKLYSVETVLMWGYRDAEGTTVIEPQFKTAYGFSPEGLAAAVDFEDRMIFIDRTGKIVITLAHNETVYYDKNIGMKVHQVYGEPISDSIESLGSYYFDRGYVMVRYIMRGTKSRKLFLTENRLLARNGTYFELPNGFSLVNYSDGAILLEKNGRYGFIDLDSGWITPAVYTSATPFVSGLSVVGNSEGKFGLINTEGEFVLPMYFDYISAPSSGTVAAYSEARGWELYCAVSR